MQYNLKTQIEMKCRIKISTDYDGKTWFQPQKQIFLWWYSFDGTIMNNYDESYSTEGQAIDKINYWKQEAEIKKFKPIIKYKTIK